MDRELIRMAIVLGLLSTIGPFAIDMYLPALPSIAGDLSTDVAGAQLTLTSYFIAFGVAQLFYGPTSDMFGRKAPIYFGLGLFAAASIGCAFAPSIEALAALRFGQGLGAAGVMSIPRAIIRDRYTGAKGTRLMSTVMLVISISPMLAPLIGSLIIVPFGWRAVFIAVTFAAGIALMVLIFALPETLPPERRVPFRLSAMLTSFATLLRDPVYLGLTFIGGFGMAAFFTFLGSASFVYIDYFGLTPTQFSLAFAANAVGFFAATQFSANLVSMMGAPKLVRIATCCYAAVVIALLLVFLSGMGSLYVMIGMLVFANLFMGLVIPSSMVLALDDHGPIAGAAAALGGTLQMLLGALAMTIGASLFDGSPVPMLAIIAACGTATFVLAIVTLKVRAPQAAE